MAKKAATGTKVIRLTVPILVGNRGWYPGDVLRVSAWKAEEIVQAKAGEYAEEGTKAIGDLTPDKPVEQWTAEDDRELMPAAVRHLGFESVDDFLRDGAPRHEAFMEDLRAKQGKAGRPRGEAETVRVSIYKDVASRATFVASVKGISVSQYLSEMVRASVNADFAKANEELG